MNLDNAELSWTEGAWEVGPRGILLAVSDGLGGAPAGEVASELSVDAMFDELRRPFHAGDLDALLQRAVSRANARVNAAARTPERAGMAATLTATLIHGSTAHLVQVGDSRAYLLRDGALRQITHDQSFVQTLVDQGYLTIEEAERSPLRSVVTSVIGQEQVNAELGRLALLEGDRLLLCSDGLSGAIDHRAILAGAAEAEPEQACLRLIDAANAAGGPDNITVIVAMVAAG